MSEHYQKQAYRVSLCTSAVNALLAADLVMAGVSSVIPFDETVSAMRSVGKALPLDLRETARGGLAATPTGRRIAEGLN